MNLDRLLERFCRYVKVDTTAVPDAGCYPSSPGQLVLGRMLADELRTIGMADVEQDAFGLVWGTLPGNISAGSAPLEAIAFCAHFDTSPETTGKDVRPIVWRAYAGGDLTLPGDPTKVLRVADNPELQKYVGNTIVTTDGTTLLGADDKAGIAVIVEAVHTLVERPELLHGPIRICLTCDEEIGHGVDHVDPKKLAAVCCYTLDGSGSDLIDVETFSADMAVVTITGINIHPSIGKGRMVNAVRAAARFVDLLPRDRLSPETTDERDGFIHPYHVGGGVAETVVHLLLRDFDTAQLATQADLLRAAASQVVGEFPGIKVEVVVTPQYRNMADGLVREPRAAAYAEQAHRNLGRTAKRTIIRGGTDGSRLTEIGVPTPNLSTGEQNPHSPLEWCCLEDLGAAVDVLVELAQVWARGGR
ncbi:MAG: peptidase T [Planctomycetia bacterium]|nr:peptidase T [Planctomycetia bacterium]